MFTAARLALVLLAAVLAAHPQIPSQAFIAKDPGTRQAALLALDSLTPEQRAAYVPALVHLLHSNTGQSQSWAAHALAKVGPLAKPALLPLLDHANVVGFAAQAIAM